MTAPPRERRSPGAKSRATSKTTATVAHDSTRCRRCRRSLRAVLSVSRAAGPVCWRALLRAEAVAA